MKNYHLVLGSQSPRRKELLAGLGFEFTVKVKDTAENYPSDLKVERVPEYLAQLKANALLDELAEDELLICADTIVLLNGEIIGKPTSVANAKEILKKLSGKTHQVITGVFIGSKSQQVTFSDTTLVSFKAIPEADIAYYIENYQPFDKAGSYGIQEWIGYAFVEKLEGSYANVMGLPTHRVLEELRGGFIEL